MEPILKKLEIKKYFENWVGENSLSERKPSGRPLLHLAKEANVAVEECLMIGDSKNDMISSRNAKMESVGLTYGYNYDEDISQYDPTVVLEEFKNLKSLLQNEKRI